MNNKFKRFNKILMMTVAILLCFVLISTSVVSGIFAKYVITQSAGATVSLKAFGLTLKVTPNSTYDVDTKTLNSTTIQAAVDLAMIPGQNIDDAFTVEIKNSSNVNANLKITVNAVYSYYSVEKDIGGLNAATTYIPIKFTAKVDSKNESVILQDWSSPTSTTEFSNSIASGIASAIEGEADGAVATEQICTLGTSTTATPSIKKILFGFEYPDQPTDKTKLSGINTDEIQTWLGAKTSNKPTLKIVYTISLEQIITTTTT